MTYLCLNCYLILREATPLREAVGKRLEVKVLKTRNKQVRGGIHFQLFFISKL